MHSFRSLFGVTPSNIKKTCLITPFLSRGVLDGLGISNISKGMLYACGTNRRFGLISTYMGAGFVGDAVLYLKETPCERLFFFGSCGAVRDDKKLGIGTLGIVSRAISQDSFVNTLLNRKPSHIFYPDKKLAARVEKESGSVPLTCLSLSSLKLEEDYLDFLDDASIDVVDMEAAVFLAAARFISRPALPLVFISDILKSRPYYRSLPGRGKPEIRDIARKVFRIISLAERMDK